MKTKGLRDLSMSEVLRLAKTEKGREFLLAEVDIMQALIKQVRLALGDSQEGESARSSNNYGPFNGSIRDFVEHYKSDNRYQTLRHATRQHYDVLLKRIIEDYGDKEIADIKDKDIDEFYRRWASSGKIAMAHALMTMLRTLVAFGAAAFEDRECERLSILLHRKRFPGAPPRTVRRLSLDQVKRIIAKAHELKLPSVALAQAFQWDVNLRQKDVIGEWVPLSDPDGEYSEVIRGDEKWVRGIRWSEIDKDMVLRHKLSKGGGEIEFRLSDAPLVVAELERTVPLRSGPVINYEKTGLPYSAHVFRYNWRRIARAAGIPKDIKNMDSRPDGDASEPEVEADMELELGANATPH
jgi:hypothetical protein